MHVSLPEKRYYAIGEVPNLVNTSFVFGKRNLIFLNQRKRQGQSQVYT